MRNASPAQADMFAKPVFESRSPVTDLDLDRFRLRIKGAMSQALKGRDRIAVAARMGRMLGGSAMSKAMLDAYTSPAKQQDISLVRFKALARAAEAPGLWDVAVSDDGLLVLQGDEARLAEIARLQQEQRKLAAKLKALQSLPVNIRRGSD
ncbi:MAG: hypothetical protein NXH91_11945 [Phyllobacteriaceae bacterium]|nr:hypothetical protein [Phyllobacteriaceae bacterium]